jgi:ketosteroid isomerase-like protein
MSNMKVFEPLSDEDLQANHELNLRFAEGICQKNIDQVMDCIWDSPDFIFVGTDGTVYLGSDSFRKETEKWFAEFETIGLELNDLKLVPAGDSVFAVGKCTYEFKTGDRSSSTLREVWTDVRQKIGAKWIYVLDHAHALTSPE